MSARYDFDMPDIAEDDSFRDVVKKLSLLVLVFAAVIPSTLC